MSHSTSLVLFSKTYRRSVRPYMDRLVLVPENGSPLPGVRFISTPGHSPGHSAIEIDGGSDEKLMVTGDTWVTMVRTERLHNELFPMAKYQHYDQNACS